MVGFALCQNKSVAYKQMGLSGSYCNRASVYMPLKKCLQSCTQGRISAQIRFSYNRSLLTVGETALAKILRTFQATCKGTGELAPYKTKENYFYCCLWHMLQVPYYRKDGAGGWDPGHNRSIV